MMHSEILQNHTALVTGGTKGIGLAIAMALGKAGASVYVASRKQAAVEDAVAKLKAENIRVAGMAANVGLAEDREKLIESVSSTFGGLNILVNNAAANPVFGPVEQTEGWAFEKIMNVNVEAPFELAKLALPHLERAANPSVLNISSIGGIQPEYGLGIYSVSKAALNSLTKVMAKEWGKKGIRVNAICPGLIKTDFSEALWSNDKIMKHMLAATPLQRVGDPDEIGVLALSIVTASGSYSTGHIYVADGGYTV